MKDIEKFSNQLNENLIKKKQHLIEILNLTELQAEAIEAHDEQKINQLIDKKQVLIDGIDELDENFSKHFVEMKSMLGIKSLEEVSHDKAESFKQVKNELNEIHQLIEKISGIENKNSVMIKKEYEDIKSKIKELGGGRKAISAYQKKPSLNDGLFFDKKK